MSLVLELSGCHGFSQDRQHTAHELLRILNDKGVVFLPLAGSPDIEPHPEKRIVAGMIYNIEVGR